MLRIFTILIILFANNSFAANDYARLQAEIDRSDEDIRKLNGKIEELEFKIENFATKLDRIISDIDQRLNSIEHNQQQQISSPTPSAPITHNPELEIFKNTSVAPVENTETSQTQLDDSSKQYEQAFAHMRNSDYESASNAFYNFIQSNPDSDLISNAYYWLGETYYVRNKFDQSAITFLKGYQQLPTGGKAADSLLKLGMSLANLDKKQEACTTFDKLLDEFPKLSKSLKNKTDNQKSQLSC